MQYIVFISVIASVIASGVFATKIDIRNRCGYAIWPGIQGRAGHPRPENGGFVLEQGKTKSVEVPDNWSGNIWARTGCDGETGHCQTGDCNSKVQCEGAGGKPPITIAEITLKGYQGLDYYDVSFVQGFNLPIEMYPNDDSKGDGGQHSCKKAQCLRNINANCPEELEVKNAKGNTIACNSACGAFDTDEYCCRGEHNTPETCRSADWPEDYAKVFKDQCPDAYSYAYDDRQSTFTCRGTGYTIKFC